MESLSSIADDKNLEFNAVSIKHLEEGAKWARFISIVGFVGVGFLVLLAFVMMFVLPGLNSELANMQGMEGMPNTSVFSGFLGSFLGVFYIIIAVLYFIPVLFLYNFSTKSLVAIREKDTEFISVAFDNLRKHYKFIGILMIIGMAIYAIIFIGAFLGGALGSMM
jgi:hypothetical protein